ncbi:MAG: SDR family NAD(P)-dependent oxidoreductase [Planctomycetota bacterium]|nr:MAG: SDR family NAD(P)-dependent oxidoreductase [Planctomycetota bacterium]
MTETADGLFDLAGKVAIVTGAGRGIGAAIAEALAASGADVAVTDMEQAAAEDTAGRIAETAADRIALVTACDVRDNDQVLRTVSELHAAKGRIDVLVNNAGIHRRVPPTDFNPRDLEDLYAVNLTGSFQMCSAVGNVMISQRSGSIINLSALGGGVVGLGRGGSIYGMTKGGIVSLTRDLAAEWGRYSIRVNALAPGWIRTPMTTALQNDPGRSARVLERVPLRRWGECEDIAGAAVFLASDASRYITGHTIPIDGGAANVIAISEEPV